MIQTAVLTFFNSQIFLADRPHAFHSHAVRFSGYGGGRSLRFQLSESSTHKHGCTPPLRHQGLWAAAFLTPLSRLRYIVYLVPGSRITVRTVQHLERIKIPGTNVSYLPSFIKKTSWLTLDFTIERSMSVADHGSCSSIVSGGQQNRTESSGTTQLLDRLGHGLVPAAFASDVGEGAAAETRRKGSITNKERHEGRPSPRAGSDRGDSLRTGVVVQWLEYRRGLHTIGLHNGGTL